MKTVITKIDQGMAVFEKSVSLVMGVLLFVLMTWCVIARYCFALPCPYQTELAQTFHIWLCFMGSSYLFSINDNPSVEIFSGKVIASKNMTYKKVYFTLLALTNYIFVVPCVYYGIQNLPQYAAQKTTYLGYSYIWIYGAAVFGFIMIAVRIALRIAGYWSGMYLDGPNEAIKNGGAEE
ncbi:MAG: TRAP transporter small permease subunit [Oscillibacter sp.]|nr:TRAP transporter small permease subunit [Oscillibacter sp.]